MKTYITKQLRERASIRGKQQTWVSRLSDEQLYQLYVKLRNGESAKSIAKHIQKAWKVSPRSTVHSVSQGILKFRGRIPDLLEIDAPPRVAPPPPQRSSFNPDDVDDLMGLELIIRGQRERIERMMREERELGVKHANLSRDVQSLAALAKVLVKEKEFALRHKDEDPVRQREEALRRKKGEETFQRLLANLPDDGERVVQIGERFLSLLDKYSVPMIKNEDGIYEPVGEGIPEVDR